MGYLHLSELRDEQRDKPILIVSCGWSLRSFVEWERLESNEYVTIGVNRIIGKFKPTYWITHDAFNVFRPFFKRVKLGTTVIFPLSHYQIQYARRFQTWRWSVYRTGKKD